MQGHKLTFSIVVSSTGQIRLNGTAEEACLSLEARSNKVSRLPDELDVQVSHEQGQISHSQDQLVITRIYIEAVVYTGCRTRLAIGP